MIASKMPESGAAARTLTRRELFGLRRAEPLPSDHWVRVYRNAMACRVEVALSGEDAAHVPAARAALDQADHVESLLSVFRETSEVSRLNARAASEDVLVSAELFAILERCARLSAETAGAFDATGTPLSRAWGFLRREGRRPDPAEIDAARAAVGMDKVALRPAARTVRFGAPGMALSFGSFGKGYALDRMVEALRSQGVPKALVCAGGSSVAAFGGVRDGFRVDVSSRRTRARLFSLRLREAAQATTGAGEQFFEAEGRRFGHVLDPRTGWPAEGVLSATAVADDAAEADALSTAFFVAGPELAERLCRGRGRVAALLVTESAPERVLLFGNHPGMEVCA
jgi:thiamine biosynthesis lipoprotein